MPVQAAPPIRTVLRALIDERGLKYVFVADKIGTTPYGLTRLMNRERTLLASELRALENVLGVSSDVFFDGNELLLSSDTSSDDESPAGVQALPGRGHVMELEGDPSGVGVLDDAREASLVPPAVQAEGPGSE